MSPTAVALEYNLVPAQFVLNRFSLPTALVLDTRPAEEFNKLHLKGSINFLPQEQYCVPSEGSLDSDSEHESEWREQLSYIESTLQD